MKLTKTLTAFIEKKKAAQHNRGLSLTETLLVLGVIALVAVIAYAGYNAATSSVKTGGEAQAIVQLQSNITKTFNGDYSSLDAASVIDAGLVPKTFRINAAGDAIANAYGGTILPIAVSTTDSFRFQIVYTDVPQDSCVELAQTISSSAQAVHIIGNVSAPTAAQTIAAANGVKTALVPKFDVAQAIALCSSGVDGAPATIVLLGS